MRPPPPLSCVPRYPVTAFTCLAAVAATISWWAGRGIDGLVMDAQVWQHWQLWRALTSTLPHVNLLHLAFNLYWVWALGTVLEAAYGHLRYAAILLFLATCSSCAEFMLLEGGVGLSGVGYGLWAMLWVLERNDPRFTGTVDRQTSQMFVFWFFLCVVLTLTNVMPVGNIAHGVGAAAGALLGFAVSGRRATQRYSIAGVTTLLLVCLAGSTLLWPSVNRSSFATTEIERAGVQALEHSENVKAVKLLQLAVHRRKAPARAWFNLGIAYQHQQKYQQAAAAYAQAAALPDASPDMVSTAKAMKQYLEFHEAGRNLLGQ